jgi:subtilase family protein
MSPRQSLRFGEPSILRPPRRILSPARLLATGLAIWSAGCSDTTEPAARPEHLPPRPAAAADSVSGKSVLPNMDTYVNSDVANRNYGGNDTLLIQQKSSKLVNRVLVSFPQGAITDSVAADSLVSATLELTIKRAGNDWGTSGRAVGLHRMTRDWLEGGATWNCANDTNVGNLKADCPGDTWGMPDTSPPFVTTPIAQSVITNGQSGVVRFDVTRDVRAFLANQVPNQGWLLKLAAETQTGTVVFHAREGASKPHLVLSVTPQQGVPAQAPDTLASWVYSASNLDSNTAALPGVFLKDIVIVEFKSSATASQRRAAVDSVHGTVVGGVPSRAGEGHYYLRVPDSTQGGGLVSAVQKLGTLPQVQLATYEFSVVPMYLRPKDDANWSSWHMDRHTLTGQNWALEAVLAPMAWGCSTGDSSLRVAVVDVELPPLPAGHDLEMTIHPPTDGLTIPGEHGIMVGSVLAARGNNGKGMTGMMWRADLHAYDAGEVAGHEYTFVGRVFQQIKNASDDGARVINVSLGTWPGWPDSAVALAARGLDSTLSALGSRGKRPLVVLAAGNATSDANVAGFPVAVNGRNGGQIIVVAASTQDSVLWVSREVARLGSNYGPLVSVAAPGKAVYHLTQTGAIVDGDGTSEAAPIVSGIAGLLLSFDSRLQATDLKSLIINGATAGGWKATRTAGGEQYRIVNAYESLKLAAQRSDAPLCGNRVFPVGVSPGAQSSKVLVERANGDQTIVAESDSFAFGQLQTFHGGRGMYFDRGYSYRPGLWELLPDTATISGILTGSTYSYFGQSHDRDTLVTTQRSGPNDTVILLGDSLGQNSQVFMTLSGVLWADVAFPPLGDELIVAQQRLVSNKYTMELKAIHLRTKAVRDLGTVPDAHSGFLSISEDGKEFFVNLATATFVGGEWRPGPCHRTFRSVATGAVLRDVGDGGSSPNCYGGGTAFN